MYHSNEALRPSVVLAEKGKAYLYNQKFHFLLYIIAFVGSIKMALANSVDIQTLFTLKGIGTVQSGHTK